MSCSIKFKSVSKFAFFHDQIYLRFLNFRTTHSSEKIFFWQESTFSHLLDTSHKKFNLNSS